MRKLLPTLLLALGASVAHADNGLVYLGAGIARDNVGNIMVGATESRSSTSSAKWE